MGVPKKGPSENENTLAETEGLEGAGNDRGCTEQARALGASCKKVVTLAGGAWGGGGAVQARAKMREGGAAALP